MPSSREICIFLKVGLGNLKYGAPLIGQLIEWPLQQMPHEIWTDMGQEYIPYMAQSFDPVKYPLLSQLHPTNVLPADMRGYVARGWDNGRGVDTGRALMSVQGDAIRDITGTITNDPALQNGLFWAGVKSATGAFDIVNTSGWAANAPRTTTSTATTLSFSAAKAGLPTAEENRVKSVAWNFIVRAK
ncbi:TPA: phage tail protein [Kluyvera georgiana]|nr:phage tail protein [Kluyvera georgiana]